MSERDFPNKLIKGIPNQKNFLDENGFPHSSLFYFEIEKTDPKREDNYLENSINWFDKQEALDNIHNRIKEGKIQFSGGAAILNKNDIDLLTKFPRILKNLTYERKIQDDNEFHGNLLLNKDVSKPNMKHIAASIANCVQEVIPNPNQP
jgi:hypothetical protein